MSAEIDMNSWLLTVHAAMCEAQIAGHPDFPVCRVVVSESMAPHIAAHLKTLPVKDQRPELNTLLINDVPLSVVKCALEGPPTTFYLARGKQPVRRPSRFI